ncbi:MAG: hypothetical protein P4L44_01340 [Oryzomonas sp.]|uniref:hypothetical protein n=1 Tax=Oryzomonas sp. TaxID=2855186 RepID=UPI00284C9915|nr:hypothetical protein [Oryzomonas sp.]MDR3578586.1 hypothetical protein [Oryzomonas sp.]
MAGKDLAKQGIGKTAIPFPDPDCPSIDCHIVVFDHPGNGYGWAADKGMVLYVQHKKRLKLRWMPGDGSELLFLMLMLLMVEANLNAAGIKRYNHPCVFIGRYIRILAQYETTHLANV